MIASFSHVSFSYSNQPILEDVSFSIEKGDFIGIVGPNGTGKTTLLKLLLGLLKPVAGTIDIQTKKIAYVAQLTPNEDLSFLASVEEILTLSYKGYRASPRQKKAIDEVCSTLGIQPLRKKKITELSGGEQQKVSLALAILKDADLLVLDEPTAGIDEASQKTIKDAFHRLNEEGKTLIIVSHSPSHLQFAKRIFRLEGKKVVEERHV